MLHPGLWKGLFKHESLELGFKFRQSGKIWQTGRQRFPDRWIDETERALTNRFQITFRKFQKLLAWGFKGAWCLLRADRQAGGEFQTGGAMTLKELSEADFRLRWGILSSFSLEGRRVHDGVVFGKCRAKLKVGRECPVEGLPQWWFEWWKSKQLCVNSTCPGPLRRGRHGGGCCLSNPGPRQVPTSMGIRFSLGAGWWTGKVPKVLTCAYKYLQIEFAK